MTRREFLKLTGLASATLLACDFGRAIQALTSDATPATATPNWEATVKAPTVVPTARVEATNAAPATATRAAVAKNTPTAVINEMLLGCNDVKAGGPIRFSRPMPEVSVSSLMKGWPNAKVQNVEGSSIHSLVLQEPGAIKFGADQKGNPDLVKVVQDGYAFWFEQGKNQWVLGSSGNVHIESNVSTLMASFGEGALRIGNRTYYFPQEDKNGGTEYLVFSSLKGERINISDIQASCLIENHNQFDTFPNGRPDVPVSAEFVGQQVTNSFKRANRVVVVSIDPSRDVIAETEHFRSGDPRLLYTNVNVNR